MSWPCNRHQSLWRRWTRCIGIIAAFATTSLNAQPVRDPGFQVYSEDAFNKLEDFHSYQPIFNGLKYPHGSWKDRISSEGISRFFDITMVHQSIILIKYPEFKPDQTTYYSSNTYNAICSEFLHLNETLDRANLRLAALCTMVNCNSSKEFIEPARALKRIRSMSNGFKDLLSADVSDAKDLVFLARSYNKCQFKDLSGQIIKQISQVLYKSSPYVRAVSSLKCYAQCVTNKLILIALLEELTLASIERFHAINLDVNNYIKIRAHLVSKSRYWVSEDRYDPEIALLCKEANVDSNRCRLDYPYSYFAESFLIDWLTHSVLFNKTVNLKLYCEKLSTELKIRRVYNSLCSEIAGRI